LSCTCTQSRRCGWKMSATLSVAVENDGTMPGTSAPQCYAGLEPLATISS
jgi:hypothetical protein